MKRMVLKHLNKVWVVRNRLNRKLLLNDGYYFFNTKFAKKYEGDTKKFFKNFATTSFLRVKSFIIILFLLLLSNKVAHAKDPLKVTYGLYASGFNVVDIQGTYALNDGTYDLTMDLETVGMLGAVAPWGGLIKSNGLDKGTDSTPLEHSFTSTWRGKVETTTFSFNQDGSLKSYILEKDDGEIWDKMPKPEVYDGAPLDMLSALYRVMNNDSCEMTQAALDGKRRFDMVFRSLGTDVLEKSRYTIFEGEAEMCEIEIVPVAGKWRSRKTAWLDEFTRSKQKVKVNCPYLVWEITR